MIFRIYNNNNAQNTNTDGWSAINPPLNEGQVATIVDPNGNVPNRELTSIPSPWGRMDLIRTAFRNVVAQGNFDGHTLDHRLISDTLDVAQIFFHLERLQRQEIIDLIRWDRNAELKKLYNSPISGHNELARALEKYLKQDSDSFNFDELNEIAILRFIHPETKAITVIGATSPRTLFYVAPGDLSVVSNYVTFGQDKPFDIRHCALHSRDEAFIVWLYSMVRSYPLFSSKFKEFFSYLQAIKSLLPNKVQAEVNQLDDTSYLSNYPALSYSHGNPLTILPDLPIHGKANNEQQTIQKNSDFIIKTYSKTPSDILPLVLPVTQGYADLFYVTALWDVTTNVPIQEIRPLNQRELPGDGSTYPYLTIGDFLEDKLIRLDNSINEDYFYAGEHQDILKNTDISKKRGYLLPLKPLFFDYFTPEELVNRKMLSFEIFGTSVVVTLNIPVKKGSISYSRKYEESFGIGLQNFDFIDYSLELALLRTPKNSHICYVLPTSTEFSVEKYIEDKWITQSKMVRQNIDGNKSIYTDALKGRLQILQIKLDSVRGIVLPKQQNEKSTFDTITYSIDLGTTNTTISYQLNGGVPKLLSWENGMLANLSTFNREALDTKELLESRLCLQSLGNMGQECSFPMRTALRDNKESSPYSGYPFITSSPSLDYQIKPEPRASKMCTGIKWEKGQNDNLKAYIDGICVLLSLHAQNIGVKEVNLTWLYPSSMNTQGRTKLGGLWKAASQEYFGPNVNISDANEAVAPYLYLTRTAGIEGRTVAMDIGGGTVDVLFTGNTAKDQMYLTSFRFGGNTLFAAPDNSRASGSGLACILKDYLDANKDKDNDKAYLVDTLHHMDDSIKNWKAEEAVEYFFALEKKFDISGHRALSLKLSDIFDDIARGQHHYRSLVLAYFTLQIYHIAELMCVGKLSKPRSFIFSGNGSKILNTLGDESFVGKLISEIFNRVYDRHNVIIEDIPIKASFNEEPKTSTAYGALYMKDIETNVNPVLMISSKHFLYSDGIEYGKNEDHQYSSSVLKEELFTDVNAFAQIFDELDDRLKLVKDMGYSKESLIFITEKLKDRQANVDTYDSFVEPYIKEQGEITEGLIFTLLSNRLKNIGLAMYNELPKN